MTLNPTIGTRPARWRPAATLALVGIILAYVGCTSPRDDEADPAPAATAKPSATAKAKAAPEAGPASTTGATAAGGLFQGWPTPAAALVISGEQLGYLEPCGCTQGQAGGLLRRYDFVERLRRDRKWPLVLVDLGSLIKDPNVSRGGPEQTKVKLRAALKALGVMRYDGFALSPDDLKVGADEAVGQFLNLADDGPRVIAANVRVAGLESKLVPSLKVAAGSGAGASVVGITAVIDPAAIEALRDPSLDLLEVSPIAETLPGVLESLEAETATQVLLVQGPPALARSLAEAYPGFEIVVRTSDDPDPDRDPEEANGGKTLIVNVGQKGKYVGVVGIFDGDGPRYRYQRVALGTQYDGAAAPMKAVIEDEFREALKLERIVENYPKHAYTGSPEGATFVGAESCKTCHPRTYAFWAATKHAQGYESLLHDPKPNTIFDAECVTCHTTGFEYRTGWVSAEATPYLKGNQCENCHGPGSAHAAAPDDPSARSAVRLTVDMALNDRLCYRCHDDDNSPHFDFPKYWGQIIHKGLDTYDDPAVHRGIPPRTPAHDVSGAAGPDAEGRRP